MNQQDTQPAGRPWIGLAGLTCALFSLLCWVGGFYAVEALTKTDQPSPPALMPEAHATANEKNIAAAIPTPETKTETTSEEVSDSPKSSLRERGAGALRNLARRLDRSAPEHEATASPEGTPSEDKPNTTSPDGADDEPSLLDLARRAKSAAQAIHDHGGQVGVHLETHSDGGFRLSFGKPESSVFGPPRPAWVTQLEAGLILGTLLFAGSAVILGIISGFSREPAWLGIVAATGGGMVIVLYVLAAILAMLTTLVGLLIIGAIVAALAGGDVGISV